MWLRRLAWASLFVNVAIVVSGGVVRLTGSGLGCPTWPQCTEDSLVPHRALGHHGLIEFGNRMVTFLIAAVAIATLVVAWRHGRRALTRLAFVLAVGVPLQALIGGISVLTDLNPWVVSFHLLASMAMICVAVVFLWLVHDRPLARPAPLAWAIFVTGWVALYVGTVVTGSGPHAGDAEAPRNGLDPEALSQAHTDVVMVLLGLTIAGVIVWRTTAAYVLLGVELAQGVVGFTQYFLDLPIGLVILHLLGAALLATAMTWLLLAVPQSRTYAT